MRASSEVGGGHPAIVPSRHCRQRRASARPTMDRMTHAPTEIRARSATPAVDRRGSSGPSSATCSTQVGPHQPTLCEGWTTHHLAAHLKIREGGPLDFVRNALPGRATRSSTACVEPRRLPDLVEQRPTWPGDAVDLQPPQGRRAAQHVGVLHPPRGCPPRRGHVGAARAADMGRGPALGPGRQDGQARDAPVEAAARRLRRTRHRRRGAGVEGFRVSGHRRAAERAGDLRVRPQDAPGRALRSSATG